MISAVGVLILTLPYPRGTVFGSTSLAFILLLLVIWLLRSSLGQAPPPRRTRLDVPIVCLLICYIVSFYNVRAADLLPASANFETFVACLLLFYPIVNSVRSSEDLERLHFFQTIGIATIGLFGLYELGHPNAVIVPGWIVLPGRATEGINVHSARIGGPFLDYELMSEWCALALLFMTFLF